MSIQDLYNITVEVKTVTETHSEGRVSEAETTKYAAVPCRLQPMSASTRAIMQAEGSLYDRETVEVTHRLFCDTSYTINENDKIFYGTIEFDIILVRNVDYMDHHQEIDLREIRRAI